MKSITKKEGVLEERPDNPPTGYGISQTKSYMNCLDLGHDLCGSTIAQDMTHYV